MSVAFGTCPDWYSCGSRTSMTATSSRCAISFASSTVIRVNGSRGSLVGMSGASSPAGAGFRRMAGCFHCNKRGPSREGDKEQAAAAGASRWRQGYDSPWEAAMTEQAQIDDLLKKMTEERERLIAVLEAL